MSENVKLLWSIITKRLAQTSPRVSDSVGLRWGPETCISDDFPKATAGGDGPLTTLWEPLLQNFLSQLLNSLPSIHLVNIYWTLLLLYSHFLKSGIWDHLPNKSRAPKVLSNFSIILPRTPTVYQTLLGHNREQNRQNACIRGASILVRETENKCHMMWKVSTFIQEMERVGTTSRCVTVDSRGEWKPVTVFWFGICKFPSNCAENNLTEIPFRVGEGSPPKQPLRQGCDSFHAGFF